MTQPFIAAAGSLTTRDMVERAISRMRADLRPNWNASGDRDLDAIGALTRALSPEVGNVFSQPTGALTGEREYVAVASWDGAWHHIPQRSDWWWVDYVVVAINRCTRNERGNRGGAEVLSAVDLAYAVVAALAEGKPALTAREFFEALGPNHLPAVDPELALLALCAELERLEAR